MGFTLEHYLHSRLLTCWVLTRGLVPEDISIYSMQARRIINFSLLLGCWWLMLQIIFDVVYLKHHNLLFAKPLVPTETSNKYAFYGLQEMLLLVDWIHMVGNQRYLYKCKILCIVPKMQVFTITSYEVSILEISNFEHFICSDE